VLCFDGDAAGSRAAARSAELALPLLQPDRSLRLALLTSGEDPDTLIQKGGPRAFQAVLDAARPLAVALYDLLAEGRLTATPEQRAALRNRLEAAARAIPDRALASEYRRALLDRFFQAGRRPAPVRGTPWKGREPVMGVANIIRTPIDPPAIRTERARNLLAILLRHPALLPEVEEPLAGLDLPEGEPTQLRAALFSWLATADVLDSSHLMDHLATGELQQAVTWATRTGGLCAAAGATSQPAEALDGWWHFFGLLRGEAELIEDRAAAQKSLVETNDPAAQQRLIRLSEALAALRGGEAETIWQSP
jgi:DNA primase